MSDKRKWVPEIIYEEYEDNALSDGLPFVIVPEDKEMPDTLFMFCSQQTGEFEPDAEGNPVTIIEMELYQYANMKYLSEGLSPEDFDKVRVALGLLPLEEARARGRAKTLAMAQTIEENVSKNPENKNENA